MKLFMIINDNIRVRIAIAQAKVIYNDQYEYCTIIIDISLYK